MAHSMTKSSAERVGALINHPNASYRHHGHGAAPRRTTRQSGGSAQQPVPSQRVFLTRLVDLELVKDILGIVIVTGALLIYGVLQERIVTIGFGAGKEVFEHSIFLVFCNRLITCAAALAYLLATRSATAPGAPLRSYAAVSLTNVIATSCQYEALRYVSFAVQTLAKSAKALPVMVWGMVYLNKRYKMSEFLHAGCITLGCSVFILSGEVASRVASHALASAGVAEGVLVGALGGRAAVVAVGCGLMVVYLVVDGLTSTWQDAMFHGYPVSVADQVLYTTAFSMGLSLAGCLATQQLWPALAFVGRNPEAGVWIVALSAASAVVQLVISWTIKRYGAVVFATIMTTRQFFSILLSAMVFMTPLTLGQWAGTLLVFGAIYIKAAQKCAEHRHMHSAAKDDGPSSPPANEDPEYASTGPAGGGGGGGGSTGLEYDKRDVDLRTPLLDVRLGSDTDDQGMASDQQA